MDDLILESVIDKLDTQEIRVNEQHKLLLEIGEKSTEAFRRAEAIPTVLNLLNALQNQINHLHYPETQMQEMKAALQNSAVILRQPVKEKMIHIHTAGKIIWVVIALFCLVCFMGLGWYNTFVKLEEYEAHDINWRYVKIMTSERGLKYLQKVETDYQTNPQKMQQLVTQEELKLRQQADARQKVIDAEDEAQKWRQAAGDTLIKKKRGEKEAKARN